MTETNGTYKSINNFTEEYKYFLREYLFRLFGIAKDTELTSEPKTASSEFPRVRLVDNWIIFAAFKRTYFKIPASDMPHVNADCLSLAISIIDAFLVCAEYKFANETERLNRYRSEVARDRSYKLAIQDGIGQWIFGSTDAETKELNLADAHISVEIDGGKASGSMEDIKAGTMITVTMDGKGTVTNVLVSASSGFGGRRNTGAA